MSPRAFALVSGGLLGAAVIAAFNAPGLILLFALPSLTLAVIGMHRLPRK